jgi:hypothetical protein
MMQAIMQATMLMQMMMQLTSDDVHDITSPSNDKSHKEWP